MRSYCRRISNYGLSVRRKETVQKPSIFRQHVDNNNATYVPGKKRKQFQRGSRLGKRTKLRFLPKICESYKTP